MNSRESSLIFSSDGHLIQIDDALEAVRHSAAAVGICGENCVVFAVEIQPGENLKIDFAKKISALDDNIAVAFSGITADAMVLINAAQAECQSQQLTVGCPTAVEYISNYLANLKHSYTCGKASRPSGVSFLIGGFDQDGTSSLWQTDPSGICEEMKSAATGMNAETIQKYLEVNYSTTDLKENRNVIALAVRALLEVVDKNMLTIGILERGHPLRIFDKRSTNNVLTLLQRQNNPRQRKRRHS